MDDRITVRPLETLEELQACHEVQRATWGFADILIIPYTQLASVRHNGGVVLGAYDGADLVGFVFGYLGRRRQGPIYLFSQRMGVLPAYQGKGVGEKLKWAQRAWALEQGLDLVVWTYDPLEPSNAWLNLGKLGGIVHHYERDIYGEHDTPLHNQLPTDRFWVTWHMRSGGVAARLSPSWSTAAASDLLARAGSPLNPITWDAEGLPHPTPADLTRTGPALLVGVPARWQAIRQRDMNLARVWRDQTRRLFEHYLGQGYAVTGYASDQWGGHQHNYYLLEKGI
jgi:predicted GNAT superfamily acetyltransferase